MRDLKAGQKVLLRVKVAQDGLRDRCVVMPNGRFGNADLVDIIPLLTEDEAREEAEAVWTEEHRADPEFYDYDEQPLFEAGYLAFARAHGLIDIEESSRNG